jgi:hypothetical protein
MLVMFVLFSAAIINGIQHTNFGGGGINLGH